MYSIYCFYSLPIRLYYKLQFLIKEIFHQHQPIMIKILDFEFENFKVIVGTRFTMIFTLFTRARSLYT